VTDPAAPAPDPVDRKYRKRLDALHKRYLAARTPSVKDSIWRAILTTDREYLEGKR
jgi:hypothetical protein